MKFTSQLVAIAVTAGFIAGCTVSTGYPVLPEGAKVVIQSSNGRDINATLVQEVEGKREYVDVPSGCRALIVHDEEAEPLIEPKLRIVRVRLDEGPNKGVVIKLPRHLVKASP